MTTNANAPVETRHKEMAERLMFTPPAKVHKLAIAQSLANLEAATNRLAEIDRIARENLWKLRGSGPSQHIAALASGHTPSPCPHCAAKDEAMAEMQADLVEIDKQLLKLRVRGGSWPEGAEVYAAAGIAAKYRPPADLVADALKAVLEKWHSNELEISGHEAEFLEALAELKSRLPLGGAK